MRELKFRTWNWLEGRYDKSPCAFLTNSGELTPSVNRIVEQCIGFKDKKGKDIYYGDIIKVDGRHVSKDCPRIYEVIEDEYYCSATTRTADGDEGGIFFNAKATKAYFTVIGNIHENPELLEGK